MKKMHVFAALTIGSYEISMTIHQVSPTGEMKVLNKVKQKLELGQDTLRTKRISNDMLKKLCVELEKMKQVMMEYDVENIVAVGSTALREAKNQSFVLEQIKIKTGLEVKVVNNPQQSFLVYEGIVANSNFAKISKDGAAVLDASAGRLRISIYNKGDLILTQNITLGSIQIREWLKETGYSKKEQIGLIREMVDYRLKELDALFLEHLKVKTLIIAGDLFAASIAGGEQKDKILKEEEFKAICKESERIYVQNIALTEDADIILPAVIICEEFYKRIGASRVWISGIGMNDGIAYEYAVEQKYIQPVRDFYHDIYSEAEMTMKRYAADDKHNYYVEKASNVIFKGLAKSCGLTRKEELLLRIAAIMHNCGSYITLAHGDKSSSYIVKNTELIGLSNKDRKMIGEIIRYHKKDFDSFMEEVGDVNYSRKEMGTIGKLAVILGIANTLDAAHIQKFETIRTNIKDSEFRITVNSLSEGVLEKLFMKRHEEFFESMFGYTLVLREKNQRFVTL